MNEIKKITYRFKAETIGQIEELKAFYNCATGQSAIETVLSLQKNVMDEIKREAADIQSRKMFNKSLK